MKRLALGFLFSTVIALFACVGTVFAQSPERGSVEGILGAGYTKPSYFENSPGQDFLVGGRFRLVLFPERDHFDRLGTFFSLEYTPVSSEKFTDPSFGLMKASESFLVIKTGLSVSALRTDSFELFLNGGAAFTRNHLAFSVPNAYGGWQNVCRYLVDDTCKSNWSADWSLEPAFRIYPKGEEGKFYLGFAADLLLKRYGATIGVRW